MITFDLGDPPDELSEVSLHRDEFGLCLCLCRLGIDPIPESESTLLFFFCGAEDLSPRSEVPDAEDELLLEDDSDPSSESLEDDDDEEEPDFRKDIV